MIIARSSTPLLLSSLTTSLQAKGTGTGASGLDLSSSSNSRRGLISGGSLGRNEEARKTIRERRVRRVRRDGSIADAVDEKDTLSEMQ